MIGEPRRCEFLAGGPGGGGPRRTFEFDGGEGSAFRLFGGGPSGLGDGALTPRVCFGRSTGIRLHMLFSATQDALLFRHRARGRLVAHRGRKF